MNARLFSYRFLSFSLCVFLLIPMLAQRERPVESQSAAHPLFTQMPLNLEREFDSTFTRNNFSQERLSALRKKLRPYSRSKDPWGQYCYAKAFDLFEYGMGNENDARRALKYYRKAAKRKLALAEHVLYFAYRYSLMNVGTDYGQSFGYLNQTILHGNDSIKAKAYRDLAGIYDSGDYPEIPANRQKAIYYLERAISYDSTQSNTLDYLAGLYEKEERYSEALRLLLRSKNEQSHLKAARWLIEGQVVNQDVSRGLAVINYAIVKLKKHNPVSGRGLKGYKGVEDPIRMLNEFFHCKQLITREQVGPYLMQYTPCE